MENFLADAGYDDGKRNALLKDKYNINPLVYEKSEHPEIYGWRLEHVIKYNKRISCKGKLGLWNFDIDN